MPVRDIFYPYIRDEKQKNKIRYKCWNCSIQLVIKIKEYNGHAGQGNGWQGSREHEMREKNKTEFISKSNEENIVIKHF